MPYTVQQLAKLAGISVRTLHYYDEVGLLKPSSIKKNGYRQYEEPELLQLQQILFFRELEFPLEEIKQILAAPHFDMRSALEDHRKLIELKKKRLTGLIKTIDKTIEKLDSKNSMTDDELYGSFSKEEAEQYAEEAKQRWGHTDAYKQSQQRVAKMTKDDWTKLNEKNAKITEELVAAMAHGSKSAEAQAAIAKHYDALRAFYEPNPEMYRGLGSMYVDDPRFKAFYEKIAPGMAVFMRDAMGAYADTIERK